VNSGTGLFRCVPTHLSTKKRLVILNIIFLVLYVTLSGSLDGLSMSGLFVVHCLLKLILSIRQRKGFHIMMAFYTGVGLITFANFNFLNKIYLNGLKQYYIYSYIVLDRVTEGAALWAIGNTFAFIGLEAFANRSFPSIRLDMHNKKHIDYLFRFVLLTLVLNATGHAISLAFITGGLQKILVLLNFLSIMIFARLWVIENNIKYRNYAIILAILQTIIALFTSYLRSDLITPAVSFYGGYFMGKGSLKYLFSYRVIPIVFMVFLFSLFFNTLSGSRSRFIDAFTQDRTAMLGYTDLSTSENERGGAMDRTSNIAQLSNVVYLVEKNGYYNGRASFPLLAALIPRALWPDKPNIELGAWFALEIGAATISPITGRANNSVNMTIPGELYLDFGWIGVIIGGILFGAMLGAFWNAAEFTASAYNISGSIWGGYLLFNALFGLGSDLQLIISLVSTYLMLLLIHYAINSYANSNRRAAVARK
jgi:hypothetical protein